MTVRESILENLKITLETVSIANGYHNDIASVQRWRQSGNSLVAVPCIVINAGPEEKEPVPDPFTTCKFTVYLDVWMRQDAADPQATDTLLNSLLGDIEKALMLDYTRSGVAKDTNIKSNVLFETLEGQPQAGIIIELEIIYQHKQNDPEISG
ncbi:MAG: hypothetical protein COS29_05240 [Candidatus Omnitrophica bacterium CG02_land_8_20_14_3_00__42_8]|nr:MAG: hypothetical protein COS29_05240 [Candidatus Omnitrophica bacterium CG02_land_8_20_14_3_00__42_8]